MNYRKSIFFTILIFVFVGWLNASAGTLYCRVATSCEQTSATTTIFRMYSTSNTHAGVATSTYTQLVCCGGVTDIGYGCSSSTKATVLYLSDRTNAHSRHGTSSDGAYTTPNATPVCISVPSGSVSVGFRSTDCTGYDTTLASISGVTNAHVGATTAYTTKICGTASAVAYTCTVSGTALSFGTINNTAVFPTNASTTVTIDASQVVYLQAYDSGDTVNAGNQPGLFGATTTPANSIIGSANDAYADSATLAANTEGYGLRAATTTAGSNNTLNLSFRYGTSNQGVNVYYVGGLEEGSANDVAVASTTAGTTTGRVVEVSYYAAVGTGTPAGNYKDTITYTCTTTP